MKIGYARYEAVEADYHKASQNGFSDVLPLTRSESIDIGATLRVPFIRMMNAITQPKPSLFAKIRQTLKL